MYKKVCLAVLFGAVIVWLIPGRVHSQAKKQEIFYVAQCKIFNEKLELVWSYPGDLCHFFPDGRVLVGDGSGLTLFDSELTPIWKKNIHVHHMLSITRRNTIVVLSSELRKINDPLFKFNTLVKSDIVSERNIKEPLKNYKNRFANKSVRVDLIREYSISGKLLRKFHLADHKEIPLHTLVQFLPKKWAGDFEFDASHVNSIHEVPVNSSGIAALQKGNFIITDLTNQMIMVLDKNLKKIIWTLKYQDLKYTATHDASILPNGNILLLKNAGIIKADGSSVEEINPKTKKVVWRHFESPRPGFSFHSKGSAQLLNDGTIFYSNFTNNKTRATIIGRDGIPHGTVDLTDYFPNGTPYSIYRLDVSDFLRNNNRL